MGKIHFQNQETERHSVKTDCKKTQFKLGAETEFGNNSSDIGLVSLTSHPSTDMAIVGYTRVALFITILYFFSGYNFARASKICARIIAKISRER